MPVTTVTALVRTLRLFSEFAVSMMSVAPVDVRYRQLRLELTGKPVFAAQAALPSCHDDQSFVVGDALASSYRYSARVPTEIRSTCNA